MFGYLGIVYACLLDAFVFNEYLNWLEWLGVGIIMTTTIAITLYLLIKGEKTSGD
jgi:drug/metabolite transporter (DMT)-like permease